MARRILFSLPVHERPDIVQGQLAQIKRLCPDAGVAVHVSTAYAGPIEAFKVFEWMPGVFVNPNRFEAGHRRGLFHIHVANYIHGLQCDPSFDTIAFLSSNELFVRGGLAEYSAGFQAGAQVEMFDPATNWHLFMRGIEQEPRIRALLAHLGLPAMFGGQAEGLFFDTALFGDMAQLYLRFFELGPDSFETEEILPQTMLVKALNGRPIAPPFTLQNYCHSFAIDPVLIAKVRSSTGFIFAPRIPTCLRSPHVGTSDLSSIFAVKRVPREDCDLRRHILALDMGETAKSAAA